MPTRPEAYPDAHRMYHVTKYPYTLQASTKGHGQHSHQLFVVESSFPTYHTIPSGHHFKVTKNGPNHTDERGYGGF